MLHTGKIVARTNWILLPMTPEVIQRVIKIGTEQKSNLEIHFGRRNKEIMEQIEPDDVKITGVYYEEPQELQGD